MGNLLLHRKEGLVLTAISIIDEIGINNLSTREIAKREGISEGAMFKHFKTKNELLRAVLDHYCQYDSDIMVSVQKKELRAQEAIIYFINLLVTYYENYPAITSVTQSFDIFRYTPELKDKAETIISTRKNFIEMMVEEGKKTGEIGSGLDNESLADVIMGAFNEISFRWRICNYQFSLKDKVLETIKILLNVSGSI